MIFAAGLGTRLRPLTDARPKALVEVGGVSMLERVALRVVAAGADRLVINTSPFHEQIADAVRRAGAWGVDVRFSHEPERPLETGGGLRRAASLFRGDRPILLHNVDVLSDAPLREITDAHAATGALATLAVNERVASRYVLFDERGLLGRVDTRSSETTLVREAHGDVTRLAFCGIHVVDGTLPALISADEADASIVIPYLRLAAQGAAILPFRMDAWAWIDIGSPERLREAEALTQVDAKRPGA